MIKDNEWNNSLVGKYLTNSHYEELGGWRVKVLYIGECGFFGAEINPDPETNFNLQTSYGFRQFDWRLANQDD